MSAPLWMTNPELQASNMISWDDCIGVDTSTSVYQATNSVTIQLGINTNGEQITVNSNLVSPFGLYSMPLPGVLGQATGTKTLSYVNNNEYFTFAGRDYLNQVHLPAIQPGETVLYASGNNQGNMIYLDNPGNITLTTGSNANSTINLVSPAINLGSSSASTPVALSPIIDTVFSVLANYVPPPAPDQGASATALLFVIAQYLGGLPFSTVGSTLVKASS